IPSTYSVSNCRDLDSSTVMTPSLPTLSMTSAISLPISGSAAELVATEAISSFVSIFCDILRRATTIASVACSMPSFKRMGLAPAARVFRPSVTMAWARTVEVVVPSPAMSLVLVAASLRSCAPILANGSLSSISLATVTPSWVTVGEPNLWSRATLRPLGPRVVPTALATMSMPACRRRRASSEKSSCFAAIIHSSNSDLFLAFAFNNSKDVAFPHDEQFLAIHFDFRAGIFGEQNLVADGHVHRDAFARLVAVALADRKDHPLLGFFLGRFREHDAARGDLFLFNRFDHDPTAEGFEIKCHIRLLDQIGSAI